MEGPLLSNSEQRSITISGDSSSRQEHLIYRTINGTRSSIQQIPNRSAFVIYLLELVVTLVQIITAILLVTQAKGEDPLKANWIIAYTCGCIANLPIICWNLLDSQNDLSDSRFNAVMNILKKMVHSFFVGWFVLFLCVLGSNFSSIDYNTPLFTLCACLLSFSLFRYVFPIIQFTATGCCMYFMLYINDHQR